MIPGCTTGILSRYISIIRRRRNILVNSIKEVTVQSATKSEEKIERAIAKQLASGTIPDANGDGIMRLQTIWILYKAQLFEFKGIKTRLRS